LTPGKLNAVRAAFKAGLKPSQIARQFRISHSDVRKALTSDTSRKKTEPEGRSGGYSSIKHLGCGLINVRFAPDSDRIADIAEGPSCARSGRRRSYSITSPACARSVGG